MNPYSLVEKLCKINVYLFDQLVPPRKNEYEVVCITQEKLQKLRRQAYKDSSNNRLYNKHAHSLLPYRHKIVTALVSELKYHRNQHAIDVATDLLAEELLGICGEELSQPLLAPVPMHTERRAERGYNPPDILCESIMHKIGSSLIYTPDALKRIRHTVPQQKITRAARILNVRKSMLAEPTIVRGHTIIVIDDVTTTGSTFHEARRALIQAGATRVYCIALAG